MKNRFIVCLPTYSWALLMLLSCAAGCTSVKLIPNTEIPDTKENRKILTAISDYREAVTRGDVAAILTMVHPSYDDASGTLEPQDDIDYNDLKVLLAGRFSRVKSIRCIIEFKRIMRKGREAFVEVWIDATFTYEHPGLRPHYSRHADYHRFGLINSDNRWLFTSGL